VKAKSKERDILLPRTLVKASASFISSVTAAHAAKKMQSSRVAIAFI
jgi:hypothetical protein